MTKKRAERLLGCEIELRTNENVPGYRFAYADNIGVCGKTDKAALEELVNTVARIRSLEGHEQSAWRCSRCGRLGELQSHHKQFRSHGGTHEAFNRESLCNVCHSKLHQKGKKIDGKSSG